MAIFNKENLPNLCLGLLNLVLFVLVLAFPLRAVLENSASLSLVKKDLLDIEARASGFEKLRQAYQSRLADIGKVEAVFVEQQLPVDLIAFLEESSRATGFEIKISPILNPASKIDPWPSLIFQVSGSGPSQRINQFLEKTENNPFLASLTNLNIRRVEPEKSKKGVNEIEFDLSLKAYVK